MTALRGNKLVFIPDFYLTAKFSIERPIKIKLVCLNRYILSELILCMIMVIYYQYDKNIDRYIALL